MLSVTYGINLGSVIVRIWLSHAISFHCDMAYSQHSHNASLGRSSLDEFVKIFYGIIDVMDIGISKWSIAGCFLTRPIAFKKLYWWLFINIFNHLSVLRIQMHSGILSHSDRRRCTRCPSWWETEELLMDSDSWMDTEVTHSKWSTPTTSRCTVNSIWRYATTITDWVYSGIMKTCFAWLSTSCQRKINGKIRYLDIVALEIFLN